MRTITLKQMGQQAKQAAFSMAKAPASQKNAALATLANQLNRAEDKILEANERDKQAARLTGLSEALIDRLSLKGALCRNKQGEVQGVWSHETALDLYELCDIMPAKLHLTVPYNFRKSISIPSILRLYHANLEEKDWTEQQGYKVTTPIKTLLDLAETRQIADDLLKQAVVEGRKKG